MRYVQHSGDTLYVDARHIPAAYGEQDGARGSRRQQAAASGLAAEDEAEVLVAAEAVDEVDEER